MCSHGGGAFAWLIGLRIVRDHLGRAGRRNGMLVVGNGAAEAESPFGQEPFERRQLRSGCILDNNHVAVIGPEESPDLFDLGNLRCREQIVFRTVDDDDAVVACSLYGEILV